jgi:hypothetical protein
MAFLPTELLVVAKIYLWYAMVATNASVIRRYSLRPMLYRCCQLIGLSCLVLSMVIYGCWRVSVR